MKEINEYQDLLEYVKSDKFKNAQVDESVIIVEDLIFNCDFSFGYYILNKANLLGLNHTYEKIEDIWGNLGDDRDSLILKNCIFNNKVVFTDKVIYNFTFDNCTFNGVLDMNNAKIDAKFRFYTSSFSDVNFENTSFLKLIDFWNSTFYKPTVFYKTDFLKTAVFAACLFKENVLFTYSLFNDKTIFRGANFEKGLDLSNSLVEGQFNFFDIDLKGFTSKNHENESEYNSLIEVGKNIPLINKRETFRIIKQYFTDNGDDLHAVAFSKYEKEAIKELLLAKRDENLKGWNSNKIIKEGLLKLYKTYWKQYRFDLLALRLNQFSNDYRNNYWLGLRFIFLVMFFSVLISFLSMSSHFMSCPEDFKLFFEYLNPTHKAVKLDGINSGWLFLIVESVTRIFMAYGIYQTVQAFRKLK